jgi:hypothetical protein
VIIDFIFQILSVLFVGAVLAASGNVLPGNRAVENPASSNPKENKVAGQNQINYR